MSPRRVFGPPYGRVWEPEPWQRERYRILSPLVPNDWTVLATAAPGRADHVAAEVAGLKKLDHLVTTHFHIDHFGGAAELSELIPLRLFPSQRFISLPAL